jgi:alkylation response protein AidB-like acyl-CoA dehydrogenase
VVVYTTVFTRSSPSARCVGPRDCGSSVIGRDVADRASYGQEPRHEVGRLVAGQLGRSKAASFSALAAVGLGRSEETVPGPGCTGEAMFSYALSEPEAGSDAAAMKTKAVRDGDHRVLNGTKRRITDARVSE